MIIPDPMRPKSGTITIRMRDPPLPVCASCGKDLKDDDLAVYIDTGVMDSDNSIEIWEGIARYHKSCFEEKERKIKEMLERVR